MANPLVKTRTDRIFNRLFEMLPGILTWGTILGCFFLSFIKPVWVAVFIICFDIYWLLKAAYLSVYLIHSYRKLKRYIKIDWTGKLQEIDGWQRVYHLIILPMVREDMSIIEPSVKSLIESGYPKDKLILVMATEERAGKEGRMNAEYIKKKYTKDFRSILITVHPKNLPDEIAAKGSNITWATKQAKKYIDTERIPYKDIITSVFDIDTVISKQYFSILTYTFLNNPDRYHASYQPIPMYFNNLWDSPALMRVVAMSHTFWMMMEQVRPERLCTFSSHAMSFKTVLDIGYWDTSVVSEDSRIFWQCLLHYNGDYKVIPLFIPVYMDTVLADTYKQSIVNQYKQQRRWAYGAENIPYLLMGFIKNKQMTFRKKIYYSFMIIEGNWSWATNAILIFLLGWLPIVFGGEEFGKTVLAQNLPWVTQILMTAATIGMFVSAAISTLLLPPRPDKYKSSKYLLMVLQWIFLPLSTIFLSSIPAIDAQTRLMFKRYMGFWVTDKVRKKDD